MTASNPIVSHHVLTQMKLNFTLQLCIEYRNTNKKSCKLSTSWLSLFLIENLPLLTFPGEEYTMKLQNLEKELDNEVPWFSLVNASSFGKCTTSPQNHHKTWQFVEAAQWKESACASWENTWSNVFFFLDQSHTNVRSFFHVVHGF